MSNITILLIIVGFCIIGVLGIFWVFFKLLFPRVPFYKLGWGMWTIGVIGGFGCVIYLQVTKYESEAAGLICIGITLASATAFALRFFTPN